MRQSQHHPLHHLPVVSRVNEIKSLKLMVAHQVPWPCYHFWLPLWPHLLLPLPYCISPALLFWNVPDVSCLRIFAFAISSNQNNLSQKHRADFFTSFTSLLRCHLEERSSSTFLLKTDFLTPHSLSYFPELCLLRGLLFDMLPAFTLCF